MLEPNSWNIDKAVLPWKEAEKKKWIHSGIHRHEIAVNDFRGFAGNVLQNFHKPREDKLPQNVKIAKMPSLSVLRKQR